MQKEKRNDKSPNLILPQTQSMLIFLKKNKLKNDPPIPTCFFNLRNYGLVGF